MAINKKLSLKVFTEKRPPLGSYEPALSPKTAPDSFSHPEDAFDLETYIGQVAPAFTLPNIIELDGINEATTNGGITIDGVLIKDGVYAFPASMTTFVAAAGNNAGTATVLTGKLNDIYTGAGGTGVALPTSPLFGQELYVVNTTGNAIRIYSNAAGANLIVVGNGYNSSSSSTDIQHNEIFKFVFTDGKWVAEVIAGPSSTLRADVISERTGTAGVTIDGVLIKDSSIKLADGTVDNLSIKIGADSDNGFYGISDIQLGVAVEGALVGFFNENGLNTNFINEQTADFGVYLEGLHFRKGVFNTYPNYAVAKDITSNLSATDITNGYITSTSAAAVALTTPTAAAIYTRLNACPGTIFEFAIDNSAGANTVTLTLDASITVTTPAITGGDTLTVSTANAIGIFKLVFISSTVAKIFRVA